MRTGDLAHSLGAKVAILAIAMLVHLLVCFLAQAVAGVRLIYLVILPLFAAALLWGWKGGLVAGLLAYPWNVCIRFALGQAARETLVHPNTLTGWAFAVLIGTFIGFLRDSEMRHRRLAENLEETNERLEAALAEVRNLQGLLPICAHCKRVRDDDGAWHEVEVYVENHSEAKFSHGICPTCGDAVYGELWRTRNDPPN